MTNVLQNQEMILSFIKFVGVFLVPPALIINFIRKMRKFKKFLNKTEREEKTNKKAKKRKINKRDFILGFITAVILMIIIIPFLITLAIV